ncbi:MAG: mechanosensitive ion channel family protein [Desulfobacterales bacterium]|nr:mechanosensitive ion channel family protein [Desulfobacterales bacterium]
MELLDLIRTWLTGQGAPVSIAGPLGYGALLAAIILAALAINILARRYLVHFGELLCQRTRNKWDDLLNQHHLFKRLASLAPVVVFYLGVDLLLPPTEAATEFFRRLAMVFFVLTGTRVLESLLRSTRDLLSTSNIAKGRPMRGYIDAVNLIIYILAGIFIIAILTDKSPWGVLSILGGFTVVLLLVFKDTILGFVASLQLAGHDMVRIGDWIEMPKYGADGDVIDVSIHTVKVQNWDKTITTIPTYALVSDTFKNWRGMSESGGRRIKRSLFLDMNSIKFCTDEMLERFSRFQLLKDYLAAKQEEIARFNRDHAVDSSVIINGRCQTNIGVFRAYVIAYLKKHPKIHQDMTFLVRHLEPGPNGLPLQIYVFSNDQVWANYEAIQADIFDHLLAVIPEFELRLFQNPTGHDFRAGLTPAA